ncbi:MAG: hypothetical protein ACP5M9_01920 [Candidatus Micrarchaeia archaeon]
MRKSMKAQATIEFMSTYGFMFLILGIAIVAIVLITTYTNTIQSTTCTPYGGLNCNYVYYYNNQNSNYGVLELSFGNSQEVPINITSINASILNLNETGVCSPTFLYPGQESICEIPFNSLNLADQNEYGSYSVNAGYCNSNINYLNGTSCTYNTTIYKGNFYLYSSSTAVNPFVTILGVGSNTLQLNPELSIPIIPPNYTIEQNGDLVPISTYNSIIYAFGSSVYVGQNYLGANVISFPSTLSDLNNMEVSCNAPYNSLLSVSYSTFYMYQPNTISINAYATNAIQIYYKNSLWKNWAQAFTTTNWNKNNGIVEYTSQNSIPSGNYEVAVVWEQSCGSGLQAVQISNIYS